MQGMGAYGVVEGEDPLVPAWAGHALGLLGLEAHAACHDEHVVGQHGSVVEQHLVPVDQDLRDLVLVEDHAVAELAAARTHDLLDRGQTKGDKEQAGLVDVLVVAVDDVDLGLVGVEAAAQPVGGHRAAGPAAEDHDLLPVHDVPPSSAGWRPAAPVRSIRSTNWMPASIERRSGQARATPSRRSS